MLQAFPDVEISVAVVWIDILRGDNREEALKATERFIEDPRVRFFYDHERVTGESFMRSVPELDEGQVLAWDIYMFYGTDAEWAGEFPPRPATHMYQLGGDRGEPQRAEQRARREDVELDQQFAEPLVVRVLVLEGAQHVAFAHESL